MKSVPATKSGVLVTSNLSDDAVQGLTVATAWGVGGAVSGEAAGSLVLTSDGAEVLISEAKTTLPASAGSRRRSRMGAGAGWDRY